MVFCWSLINTFKTCAASTWRAAGANTVLMCAAYLGSYRALAMALTGAGHPMNAGGGLQHAVRPVGGGSAGGAARRGAVRRTGSGLRRIAQLYLVPLAVMWLVTLLPEKVRGAVNQATRGRSGGGKLPQPAAPGGPPGPGGLPQPVFRATEQGLGGPLLQMNQNITILQDYSAGSNATTMLCMDKTRTSLPQIRLRRRRGKAGRAAPLAAGPSRTGCLCARFCAPVRRTAAAGMT